MCVILCMMDGGSVEGMKALGVMGALIVIFTILGIGRIGANMVLTTAGGSMRADLVDYEYVRSGHYMPAVLAGVYSPDRQDRILLRIYNRVSVYRAGRLHYHCSADGR